MSSYTITITPNDDSGASASLVVDAPTDQVRITDVHLHAAAGLADGQLPTIDVALLLRAVAPAARRVLAGAAPTTPAGSAAPADTAEPPAGPVADDDTAPQEPTPPAATEPPPARTRRRAAKKATPTRKTGTRASRKTTAPEGGGRVYRRMPEDFAAVYAELGSPSAAAKHYDVPRHTAQGWVRRLKTTNDDH